MQEAKKPLVVTHERPDGDAIGSCIGMALALKEADKGASALLGSGLPSRYDFLPGADLVTKFPASDSDLVIAVDCADARRMSVKLEDLPRAVAINIDHHPTNTRFAEANLLETGAASTTEMLFDFLPQWGFPISQGVATNLLVGILTDTIGFRTSSTTGKTLRIAADLIDMSLNMAELYDRVISRMSFVAANYWGAGLAKLRHEDGLVWTSLTLEDRQKIGYPGSDDADLVNLLMTIDEARVVALFVEQPGGTVKVSWRSQPDVDVSAVASAFGGGGHKPAAGAMIEGDLEEVQLTVLAATRKAMRSP
jgi:phosphoesterase RecJ-like protein